MKVQDPAIPEIEGLAEAQAARAAVRARLDDLQGRLSAATVGIQRARRQRDELVARTAAGEDVPAIEISAVDGTIAELESKEAMLREALPKVEKEMTAAGAEVAGVISSEGRKRHRQASAALEKAQAAMTAARAEAGRLFEVQQLWQGFASTEHRNEERAIATLTSPSEAMRI
ncbi:Hypothetical protein RADP37_05368 [Roseomonas mucosa]|uniref:Chromosome segregation protein SMC n=1 Tax=Roseomonas mucosa TaxID=207340 RepID=A0A4Y1MZ99_9PROT|nr:Hypothetical protein RADP37_05368 [Roseomonas mucosa]